MDKEMAINTSYSFEIKKKAGALKSNSKKLEKDMHLLISILEIQKKQLALLDSAVFKYLQTCKRPNG